MDEALENKLREFIKKIFHEELDEITTTGDVQGYSTPFAYKDTGKGYRKQKKKKVHESLDKKDIDSIKILIRKVVADVIRDIWIKRTAWT